MCVPDLVPGVASLDAIDNIVPYIGGEEEKLEIETPKIFGTVGRGIESETSIQVTAHTNRVPVDNPRPLLVFIILFVLFCRCTYVCVWYVKFVCCTFDFCQVIDGHTACISFSTRRPDISVEQLHEAIRGFQSPVQLLGLPSGPVKPIHLFEDEPNR